MMLVVSLSQPFWEGEQERVEQRECEGFRCCAECPDQACTTRVVRWCVPIR